MAYLILQNNLYKTIFMLENKAEVGFKLNFTKTIYGNLAWFLWFKKLPVSLLSKVIIMFSVK